MTPAIALLVLQLAAGQAATYDVVVYGGTSAGVAAAVQAARMGKSVVLIEPGEHLGGLTSGGLGWTDSGNKNVIGGIARDFYRRVKTHYDQPEAWKFGSPERYDRYRSNDDAMWTFEPHVAEQILDRLVDEHEIKVERSQPLERPNGVKLVDGRITAIITTTGKVFTGRMFIDATYEGDLMAAARVSFTVGRESNQQYGESLNGVQTRLNTHNHRFVKAVDPYIRPGDPSSGLLPGVHDGPPGEEGSADHRLQAYCFRMCMSNVPENRVPFVKPANYDALRYELLLRNFEAGDPRLPLKIDMMPNGKTDTNNNCAFSTDNIGMNYDYPEASYERRAEILREHLSYQQGLMWTLANHPRVPESVRNKMQPWGMAKDEFVETEHWPHQLYIREARRMVGDYVMSEADCRRRQIAEDSVGLGSYNMDSHNAQRYVTANGTVQNEGDVQVSPRGAYLISYRSLVPKRGECPNLLVPVCLSSSHIAYGSIRMEPVFMILGQSAATAACQAMDAECSVQDLPYGPLRERLLQDHQVLDLPEASVPDQSVRSKDLPGIVIDDRVAETKGAWVDSTSTQPFVDYGYLHDGNVAKGELRCLFRPQAPTAVYEVRIAYSAHGNRATNVPITIRSVDGEKQLVLNQRRAAAGGGPFASLGRFRFDKRSEVMIENKGTDGYVIVDALQLIPQNGPGQPPKAE